MSYGKVFSGFWTDDKMVEAPNDAKIIALYLLTGPHRNMIGCSRVPSEYLMGDLKYPIDRVSSALRHLSDMGFIIRDDRTGWTLICNQLKYDPLGNDKHAKAAARLALDVPKTSHVRNALAERLMPHLDRLLKGAEGIAGYPIDTLSIPKPSPEPLPAPAPEPSVALATGAVAPSVDLTEQDLVWKDGLTWLAKAEGKSADILRTMVGRWCKVYGTAHVLGAMTEARSQSPPVVGPVAWIEAALAQRNRVNGKAQQAQTGASDSDVAIVLERQRDKARRRDIGGPGGDADAVLPAIPGRR